MLKINLLPVRQLKKRANAKKQLLGMLLLFILVIAVSGVTGALQAQKISNLGADIKALQKEKRLLYSNVAKNCQIEKRSRRVFQKNRNNQKA